MCLKILGMNIGEKEILTIGKLKEIIKDLPDDLPCITDRYSDYSLVTVDEPKVVEAVNQGFYIMRAHPSMSEENLENKKKYFYMCEGN